MKRFLQLFFSLLVLIAIPVSGLAQSRITVTGTVTDDAGLPVVGAVVSEAVSAAGRKAVITSAEGKFQVTGVPEGTPMTVSCLGYRAASFTAAAKPVDIILAEEINQLDKAVVVGYGTIRKRDMTGAVISVSSQEIENKLPTDVFEAMQGQVPGVQIVTNSGAPGEGATVRVRGISTFGDGVTPLYVVDGMPVDDAEMINPADIQSIEILKDAASAAIYGSRSANGVVLITTKKGTPGRARLQARYQLSSNAIANCIDLTTPEQFRQFDRIRQGMGETGASPYTDPYNHFQNSPYNVLDYIFRPSMKHQLDLSASGGHGKTKHYAGLGFINEDGIIVNSGYSKVTMRLNLEYEAIPKVRLGHKIFASYANQNGLYSESGVLTQLYDWVPYWNIFMADGSPMHNIENRNSALTYAIEATNKNQKVNTSILNYIEIDILPGLKWTSNLSGSFNSNRTQTYKPTSLLGTVATDKTTGTDAGWYTYTALNENFLNWTFKKGVHDLSVLVGNSVQFWHTDYAKTTGIDYTTDEHYTLNFASSIKVADTTSTISEHSLLSGFSRVTYNLMDKYLLAANLRADASSRFGANKKWGYFPSVSAGWRFSEEKFMEWSSTVLHEGKIRASYGLTGNDAIGNYDAWMIYAPGQYYEGVSGIAPSRLGNPELGWETTRQLNLGLDLSFLNNRYTLTLDIYNKDTSDLLYQTNLPKETGFSTITRNVGAMNNRGAELSLNANIVRKRNWNWDLNFNISTNDARIVKLADGVPFYTGSNSAIYVQEGARVGEFYGYAHENIFQYDESNAFTPEWTQLTPVFEDGVFSGQYLLDGKAYTGAVTQKTYSDGAVFKGGDVNWIESPDATDGVIDPDDRVLLGCAQADFFGGLSSTLSYKNLSLYVSMYYSIGGQIFNFGRKSRNSFQRTYTSPEPEVIDNMWTAPGDDSVYPRPISTVEYNRLGPSDFWIEDASYIKLRNVKLTYKLPRKWVKKAGIKDLTSYIYGNNLLTWTAYKGFDPEFSGSSALSFGIDSNRYPRKREYGFGITLAF